MQQTLPYIPESEFNAKVEDWAKDNFIFINMKKSDPMWTWEKLPIRLMEELFEKVGAKPAIYKY